MPPKAKEMKGVTDDSKKKKAKSSTFQYSWLDNGLAFHSAVCGTAWALAFQKEAFGATNPKISDIVTGLATDPSKGMGALIYFLRFCLLAMIGGIFDAFVGSWFHSIGIWLKNGRKVGFDFMGRGGL